MDEFQFQIKMPEFLWLRWLPLRQFLNSRYDKGWFIILGRDSAEFEVHALGGIHLIKYRHILPLRHHRVSRISTKSWHKVLVYFGEPKQIMTMKITYSLSMLPELVLCSQLSAYCTCNYFLFRIMAHKGSPADESSATVQFAQLLEIISSLQEELPSI